MQDTFPVGGDDVLMRPTIFLMRWRRFTSAEGLTGRWHRRRTEARLWSLPNAPSLSQIALGEDNSVTPVDLRRTAGQEGITDPPHWGSDLGVSDGMHSRGCHGGSPSRGNLRTAQGNDAGVDRGSLRWGSGHGREW